MTAKIHINSLHWKRSWRVINTRYPEVNLYERVVPAEDLPAIDEVERITSNRARQEAGEIHLLRSNDYFGEGCSNDVKASFSYRVNGRFSNRDFSAYYSAESIKTAACEKAYHYIQ